MNKYERLGKITTQIVWCIIMAGACTLSWFLLSKFIAGFYTKLFWFLMIYLLLGSWLTIGMRLAVMRETNILKEELKQHKESMH